MSISTADTATFASAESQQELLRHPLEGPSPALTQRFFPFGFPVDVDTNSSVVLALMENMWGRFNLRFPTEPIHCEVIVVESAESECPPAPVHHLLMPFVTTICDGNNFSIADVERSTVRTRIAAGSLAYPAFVREHLLSTAYSCICTRYVVPIHAACVSWNSRGFLLCGDSGAGKSTLAYACAQDGWVFTSDDATYLRLDGMSRHVTGNCHQVRLRPESAVLFPEIASLKLAERAAGKPSVEVPTETMPEVSTSPTAVVDFIVFLNRSHAGPCDLLPSSPARARDAMRATLYGVPAMLSRQYRAIDHLLTVPVYELRYRRLEDAIRLLRAMAGEGGNANRVIATL